MNKKLVGAVMVLLLVLTVAGAGCTTTTTTTSPTPLAQTTQTGQASSKNLTLTVTPKGEATTIGTLSKADNGSKYVLYNAVLKNINVKGLDINPFWFDMRLSNGSSVGLDLFATVESPGYFPLTNATQPGDTVNGTIVFQIAQNATPVAITYYDLTYNVTANL
ncbi:MAG: DUF4352 domain-containing protein [Euryarchaeota archaeon]